MTGAELAAIRRAAGLSQTDLARRVGIGRHAVSYWETKAQVDLRGWAVRRMATVLPLPDSSPIRRAHPAWAERQPETEREEMEARMAECREREAQRAASRRVQCNARTRKGTPCRCLSEPGKARCKFYGGMSTGARTPEGKARIIAAQRQRWARWRAERGAASQAEARG